MFLSSLIGSDATCFIFDSSLLDFINMRVTWLKKKKSYMSSL